MQPADAVSSRLKIALMKKVHSNQSVEFEGVGQFDAYHLFEDEGE